MKYVYINIVSWHLMDNIKKNIIDLKNFPLEWYDTIKIFVETKFISNQEKNDIFIHAKKQSENILMKNGLIIPFIVYLEDFNIREDIFFRTLATYHKNSSINGMIKISIKSHLLSNNVNIIVHNILHEYSHAIYEEGFLINPGLGFEILNLKKYYTRINYKSSQDDFIVSDIELEKEQFCEFFSLFLTEKLYFEEEKENIKIICSNIIKKYNSIHENYYDTTSEHQPDAPDRS